MAKCVNCGSETQLYSNEMPICVQCANRYDVSANQQTEQSGADQNTNAASN
jgi:hypothetical protein